MPARNDNPLWPFADPPNLATITTRFVMEGSRPILLVTHEADEGSWQLLCGTTSNPDDARVVALRNVYELDPTIGELADLPFGWCAWRHTPKDPWIC